MLIKDMQNLQNLYIPFCRCLHKTPQKYVFFCLLPRSYDENPPGVHLKKSSSAEMSHLVSER